MVVYVQQKQKFPQKSSLLRQIQNKLSQVKHLRVLKMINWHACCANVNIPFGDVHLSRKTLLRSVLKMTNFVFCVRTASSLSKRQYQRKCIHEGCRSSRNTLHRGAERVFPLSNKKKNNIPTLTKVNFTKTVFTTVDNAKSMGTNSSSELTSITDVKGFLQVFGVDLVSPSYVSTRAAVLCDTACSHSWISSEIANRLQCKKPPFKLTVKGIKTQKTIITESSYCAANSRKHLFFVCFTSLCKTKFTSRF